MSALLRLWDLVTSDPLTLTAAGGLAVALLGVALALAWPKKRSTHAADKSRSSTARTLAAAGTPTLEIARKTGLSRDAVALMQVATQADRQKQPTAARPSLLRRSTGNSTDASRESQVSL